MRKNGVVDILLGIGIGLILSSGLHIIKHENNQIVLDQKLIKSEAKKLGMIDPVEYFDKSNVGNIDGEKTNTNNDIKKKLEDSIIIEIRKGYRSEDVSKTLKQNNLIVSEKIFLNKINERGVENKLRWGIYEFKNNESDEQIIDRIVNGNYIKD